LSRKPLTAVLLFILLLSAIEISPVGFHVANAAGDFTITPGSPSVGPISVVGQGTTSITVSAVSGFTGAVALTTTINPPTGLSAGLNPSTVSITGAASSASSTLVVNASAVGNYQVVVKGTSGSLSHSTTVTVTVIQGGLVCIADPATVNLANPCSAPPGPTLRDQPPISPARQLSVGVYINGSSNYNAFDVTLLVDHTILLPIGTSLVGTTLGGSPTTLIQCVGGKLLNGPSCSSTDTADTIHLSASGTFTSSSGLLFEAIYNVTGSTTATGIPLGFQVGCLNTSVRNVCVNIGQGTQIPVPERTQGGFFADVPDFSITITTSVTFVASTTGGAAPLKATSLSGFSGTVTLSAVSNSTNLSASFSPLTIPLTSGGKGASTLNLASSVAGNYTVLVTGTAGALSHSANVTVIVQPKFDFSITDIPSTVTFDNSTSATSIVKLTSINFGYVGTVNITRAVSPLTGLSLTFNTTSVILKGAVGTTNSSLVTFTSSTPGDYLVTITARNATSPTSLPVHKTSITVHVADFSIGANPPTVIVYRGAPNNSTIGLISRFNFAGVVSLTTTLNATGLTATLGNSTVILVSGGSNRTTLILTGSTLGNYTVTITAVRGSITHKTVVVATVKPADFAILAGPTTVIALLSSSNSSTITVTRLGGFNGTINLAASSQPSSATITLSLTQMSITLSGTSKSGTSILNITVASNAIPGTYVLTVTGTNTTGSPSHQAQLSLIVLQPNFIAFWTLTRNGSPVVNNTYEVNVGLSLLTQVQIFSVNHFAGTVSLVATVQPTGLTPVFNQSSFNIVINGPSPVASLTITASPGTVPGNYTVTLTATGGSIVRIQKVNLVIGDFQVAGSSSIGGSVGFNSTTAVSISSINHFLGNVTVTTTTSSSSIGTLLNATFIGLPSGASHGVLVLITVANNTAVGTYTVTIIATSGPDIHQITITVTVVLHDIAITSVSYTADSQTIGTTVTYTIIVENQGSVSENVTVDALAGPFTVAQQNLTNLLPGDTQTVTLKWTTRGYAAGTYPLGAKAVRVTNEATTANNIMYSKTFFALNAPPPPVITTSLIIEIAALAAVAIIVALAIFLFRRRKPTKTL
jgi:CARDB protein